MLMEGLKMDDLMEAEGLRESDVWGIGEIEEIEPILPMELSAEVPGMDRAMVCGDPFRLGEILDYQQGFDNPYGATGTCGLTSVSNICKMAGMDVTEPEVVEYAMENDQCIKDDPKYHGEGQRSATIWPCFPTMESKHTASFRTRRTANAWRKPLKAGTE